MAQKYYVEMTVSFSGEIVASSQAEAEDIAYSGWGETSDALIQYDGVENIKAKDLGELCEECEEVESKCDCEGEGEA